MSRAVAIPMTVNGVKREGFAEARKTLADFLREDLGLTGTHLGCEHGMCGACTVIVNGDAVRSCLMLAVQARSADVLTIEGLAHDGRAAPDPGSDARNPRLPVRFLRARLRHVHSRASRRNAKADRNGHPRSAFRQPLPLYRLPVDHRGRAAGGAEDLAGRPAAPPPPSLPSGPPGAPGAPGGPGAPGMPPPGPAPLLVGTRHLRVEDTRMLTGSTDDVNDVSLPGMLHAAFLRSPHPHATITGIDTSRARAVPGVVAVYTSVELRTFTNPMKLLGGPQGFKTPVYFPLAVDKVRYVGDPVALVIAETRAIAEDACEAIAVSYSPLQAVSTLEQALDPTGPPVFEELGDNVLYTDSVTYGDVDAAFAQAGRVVKETFRQHRYAPVPLETRGGVASFDSPSGELTYHVASQSPHAIRFFVGSLINQPSHLMRVVASDVGGSFGLKWFVYREDVAICAVSKQLGRPVKWIEDRREHLQASGHAREETLEIEAAVKNDGTVLGLKGEITMNQGAYPALPFPSPLFPTMAGIMLPGPYRFAAMRFDTTVVASNKASYVAYRGPWGMETWARERLLDNIARELDMDPIEIPAQEPGHQRAAAHQNAHWAVAEKRQRAGDAGARRSAHGLQGLPCPAATRPCAGALSRHRLRNFHRAGARTRDGMSMGAKWGQSAGLGGLGGDRAHLRIEPDGSLSIITAQTPHGQGHETTLAQVAADELGIPFENVKVLFGDTRISPFSIIGTGGSRAATMAAGAVVMAARALKKMIFDVAAKMLEAKVDDLVLASGIISVKGAPQKMLPLAQLAMMAYMAPATLPPPGVSPGFEVTLDYDGGEGGWSQATHACIVEVDAETGVVRVERYQVVEDCGTMINPAVVEGQVRGGVAQGIGSVLLEHARYDDQGHFLAPTFWDYLLPTCAEIPAIAVDELQTQPASPLNARGVGESGAIASPAAVTNAIFDALEPLKAKIAESSMPSDPYSRADGNDPVGRALAFRLACAVRCRVSRRLGASERVSRATRRNHRKG